MERLNISLAASLVNSNGNSSSTSIGQGNSSSTPNAQGASNVVVNGQSSTTRPSGEGSTSNVVVNGVSSSSRPGASGIWNAFVNGQGAPSITPIAHGASNVVVNGETSSSTAVQGRRSCGHNGSKLKMLFFNYVSFSSHVLEMRETPESPMEQWSNEMWNMPSSYAIM